MTDISLSSIADERPPESRVDVRVQLIVYLALWLLAAVSLQFFMKLERPIETELSPVAQRLELFCLTPLGVAAGIASMFSATLLGPGFFFLFIGNIILFGVHGTFILRCSRLRTFAYLTLLQAFFLIVGVVGWINAPRFYDGP